MAIFKGSGVAIVTPFQKDGSIDYDMLDRLIDYHCENGTEQHHHLRYYWGISYHDGRRAYGVCKVRH